LDIFIGVDLVATGGESRGPKFLMLFYRTETASYVILMDISGVQTPLMLF